MGTKLETNTTTENEMSNVAITTENGLRKVKVNGRFAEFAARIQNIEKQGACTFVGTANGHEFEIFGGRHAGGRRTDWFLQWDALGPNTLHCNSLKEAIQIIENS